MRNIPGYKYPRGYVQNIPALISPKKSVMTLVVRNKPVDASSSVVLVWLHIIRFSFSKNANEEQSLILVLVSQLKRKKGY